MRAPFYLTCCALICAIGSFIHGSGFDGLALAAILLLIIGGAVKTVADTQKDRTK